VVSEGSWPIGLVMALRRAHACLWLVGRWSDVQTRRWFRDGVTSISVRLIGFAEAAARDEDTETGRDLNTSSWVYGAENIFVRITPHNWPQMNADEHR